MEISLGKVHKDALMTIGPVGPAYYGGPRGLRIPNAGDRRLKELNALRWLLTYNGG